jgi:hypothetical protein
MNSRYGQLLTRVLALGWLGVAMAPTDAWSAEPNKLGTPSGVQVPQTGITSVPPANPSPTSNPAGPPPSPCPYPATLTHVSGPLLSGTFCVLPGPIQGCLPGTQPTGIANGGQGEIACCPAGDINVRGNPANTSTDAAWCCPAAPQGALAAGVSSGQGGYPFGGLPAGTCVVEKQCQGGPGNHNLCPTANGTATINPGVVCPPGFQAAQPGLSASTIICFAAPACPSGYTLRDGKCAPNRPPPPVCPAGQSPIPGGGCCPTGQLTSQGICCPAGEIGAPGGASCCPGTAGGKCQYVPPVQNLPTPQVALPASQCPNGLVRRDAFRGDPACVTTTVHDQTIADNTAGPLRTRPDGGCIRGYVWREASADDHVCVLPATRTQTRSDNQRQCGGDLHCRTNAGSLNPVVKTVVTHPRQVIFRPSRPKYGTTKRSSSRETSNRPSRGQHFGVRHGSARRR